jgi:hypothetical protein
MSVELCGGSAAVRLAQVVRLETGDLEIDHGTDVLELCHELGIPSRSELDLHLTQVRGRSEQSA